MKKRGCWFAMLVLMASAGLVAWLCPGCPCRWFCTPGEPPPHDVP